MLSMYFLPDIMFYTLYHALYISSIIVSFRDTVVKDGRIRLVAQLAVLDRPRFIITCERSFRSSDTIIAFAGATVFCCGS